MVTVSEVLGSLRIPGSAAEWDEWWVEEALYQLEHYGIRLRLSGRRLEMLEQRMGS